jgi:hypothetical protein
MVNGVRHTPRINTRAMARQRPALGDVIRTPTTLNERPRVFRNALSFCSVIVHSVDTLTPSARASHTITILHGVMIGLRRHLTSSAPLFQPASKYQTATFGGSFENGRLRRLLASLRRLCSFATWPTRIHRLLRRRRHVSAMRTTRTNQWELAFITTTH